MIELPAQLIKSLTSLGLLESEAKVYAALVLLKNAGIKDLLEFLDVSKPRIYDGLRTLEENDLIVLTSPRPATYQAVSPNIALEMLVEQHNAAKNDAVRQFQDLESNNIISKSSAPLWFIFGGQNFEFKIRDMIAGAKESIYCITSEKNLDYIEIAPNRSIKIQLIIISDNKDIQSKLEHKYNKNNTTIATIDKARMMNLECTNDIEDDTELAEIANLMDIDNYFVLVVDDSKVLFMPPLKGDSTNAISIENKVMVKIFMHNMIKEPFLTMI